MVCTITVTRVGKAKFNEAMIDEPAGYFKGKRIRVTGTVSLKGNRLAIDVDDPKQIAVVATTQ
jgi:hypothetical protein